MSITKSYRPDIDGLRAIAILTVVLFHAGLAWVPGGYVGVDIFFVISGYLITAHTYNEVRAGTFSFATFYTRRAKRILPALLVVLAASLLAGWLLMTAEELRQFTTSAIATIVGASNMLFWWKTNYFAPTAEQMPLLMTWSLGIEEQFYFVFPILLLLLYRFRQNWLFGAVLGLCIVSFALAVVGVRTAPSSTFYLLPMRAWELGAGALLAISEIDRHRIWQNKPRWFANAAGLLGLGLIAAAVVFFGKGTPFPGEAALLPVLGAVLLIAGQGGWVNRYILSLKPLTAIGLVSYSWYLWHWPLLSFGSVVTDRPLPLVSGLALITLALALAVITYKYIEQPFRHTKLMPRTLLPRYGVVSLVAAVLFAIVSFTHGMPARFGAATHQFHETVEAPQQTKCLAGYGESKPDLTSTCLETTTTPAVVLLGDSHAAAMGEALRDVVHAKGQTFHQLTKASCPALGGVTRYMPNHPLHAAECLEFNQTVLDKILATPSMQTVIIVGYWTAPIIEAAQGSRFMQAGQDGASLTPDDNIPNFQQGIDSIVTQLSKAGKNVIVMHDIPILQMDPVRRALAPSIPLREKLANLLVSAPEDDAFSVPATSQILPEARITQAIDNLKNLPNVTVVNPASIFCPSGSRCNFAAPASPTTVYYRDYQHLSRPGALLLGNALPLPTEAR